MCACLTHALVAGDPVKLTVHFDEVADAAEGPLRPGEIGRVVRVYHWRRGMSFDVRACDGSVWWYKDGAIEFARARRRLQMPRPVHGFKVALPAVSALADGSGNVTSLTTSVTAQQMLSPISVAKAVAIDLTSSKMDPANFAFNASGEDAISTCNSRRSSLSDSSEISDSDREISTSLGQISIDVLPSGRFGYDTRLRSKRLSNIEGDDHIVLDLSDFASARC